MDERKERGSDAGGLVIALNVFAEAVAPTPLRLGQRRDRRRNRRWNDLRKHTAHGRHGTDRGCTRKQAAA